MATFTSELAIIGAGNMAEAIARGILRVGLFRPDQMIAADVALERREVFNRALKIHSVEAASDAAGGAKRVLLSVKPQQMSAALRSLAEVMDPRSLVISIAAGVSTAAIENGLGPHRAWRVIRAMPNTPMLVGEGMTVLSAGRCATAADLEDASRIFAAAGSVMVLPEDTMDAVTALSGSGPAYFFYLVEHMIRAGIEMGLAPEQAKTLATQTAVGAATMLKGATDTPAELRKKVTSPGGTTQAAVSVLENAGVGEAIINAIRAALERSRELGSR